MVKKLLPFFLIALLSSVLTVLLNNWISADNPTTGNPGSISAEFWPEFDKLAPYTLNGPLWVGYDAQAQQWRFLKIAFAEKAGDVERGLSDPGDPSTWTEEKGKTGYFDGNLAALPSGTHLNNRYDPSTQAHRYKLDDYIIKVGNFWVDQYESSILLVNEKGETHWIDDPESGAPASKIGERVGTGFYLTSNYLAVSQRRKPSSGITYYVAEQCAVNNGKHIIRNEQWQAAAGGTARTDATGMESGGQSWETIDAQDISRFGVVGCAGSLWEWTSSWGQYGEHYEGPPTNWYDWPGPQSYVEIDDRWDTYGNDVVINIAGRAFTRQDSARYAVGLPAAVVRGGSWGDHQRAGIFALIADGAPTYYGVEVGFRCVK